MADVAGGRINMVKLIIFMKQETDHLLASKGTKEEWVLAFQEEVTNAVGRGLGALDGVEDCVVSNTLLSGYRRGSPLYDSVAELCFSDEGEARRARASDAYSTLESNRIISRRAFASILTREHVAKDGPKPFDGVKSFEFVTHRPGMPIHEFGRYWREVHGPLAARIPMIRRYVQSHCVPTEYQYDAQPEWDGVAVTWFDNTAEMRRSAETMELAETRADEPNFLAPGHLPFIITTEVEPLASEQLPPGRTGDEDSSSTR
jgi:uncharacterized protein (TIGR02118 family)